MKKDMPEISPTDPDKPNLTPKKGYFEIKIPLITLKKTPLNIYLVIALIIFAFMIGMMTNKILYLQNALKEQTAKNIQGTQVANAAAAYPTPPPKVEVSSGHLAYTGNQNAKVTVVQFCDFQCPFCKQFFDDTYKQLYDTYIKTNKIKFTYRHYPLNTIHPNAQKAAEATECANEQKKFWNYHDLIFQNQSTWSAQSAADAVNSFTEYAGQLGLNSDQFRSCLETDKYKQSVLEDQSDGNKAVVDGTPTFFINGWRLVGAQPFSQIQQLIEQELKK